MAVKEAKSNPWKVLERRAESADAAAGQACWNSKASKRKVGDILMGTVSDPAKAAMTGFGRGEVLEIETPDKKKVGVFLSVVLRGQIENAGGFQKGDRVFVKYLGIPEGKHYVLYAVGKA